MFVPFNTLPDSSKVWIYEANREFKTTEVEKIDQLLTEFVSGWKRHGEDLRASYKLLYNQFVVLAVDESFQEVSGCSIDASVAIIKQLQEALQVDLLNKMQVTFKDGDNINTVSLKDFKEYARQQKINGSTVVFNNLVRSKGELESSWETRASQSWHAKFLV